MDKEIGSLTVPIVEHSPDNNEPFQVTVENGGQIHKTAQAPLELPVGVVEQVTGKKNKESHIVIPLEEEVDKMLKKSTEETGPWIARLWQRRNKIEQAKAA